MTDRTALTREERLELYRQSGPIPVALRRLDKSCPDCGRQESFTHVCSWCLLPMTSDDAHPASVIRWDVRAAAVVRHGWRSDRLCPELRHSPARTVQDAAEAGSSAIFPPVPTGEPPRRSKAA